MPPRARTAAVPWDRAEPAPLVLVTGPEELLAERAVDRVAQLAREQAPDLDVVRLDGATYQAGRLRVAASPSLFDEPRLVVQVKSEAGAVGSPVVGQLLGAMSRYQTNQGLLVAWGGVTKAAEQLLTNEYFRLRVWSSKELLEAIFRTYDRLPEELRTELPLKRIWTLVEEAG